MVTRAAARALSWIAADTETSVREKIDVMASDPDALASTVKAVTAIDPDDILSDGGSP